MGFQHNGACYDTPAAAAMAAATENAGRVLATSGGVQVVSIEAVTDGSITYRLTGPAATTTVQAPYVAQQCQLIETGEAVALSWAVVGVWVAAWSIRLAIDTIRGTSE